MGRYNSSRWVVKPFFDKVIQKGKMSEFLKYVLPNKFDIGSIIPQDIRYEGYEFEGRKFGEKVVKPVPEYLQWCRDHAECLSKPELAKMKLAQNSKYVFERGTHPDVFIETSTLRLVIEAKWTESRITSHTTWRKGGERDQLIRHMDALLPFHGGDAKKVFGLFIIDAEGKIQREDIVDLFNNECYFMKSLPHRVPKGYEIVQKGFCGVFTWQQIGEAMNIHIRFDKTDDGRVVTIS